MKIITKEDGIKIVIVSIIFLIITVITLTIITMKKQEQPISENPELENKFTIVDNYNIFFFVSNNINNYINYNIEQNYSAVLNLLDTSFKNNNNINLNNINNKITFYQSNCSYSAKLTKSFILNDNITVYYTEGNIIEEGYDETTIIAKNVKYLLYVDFNKMIISIELINNSFNEEDFIKQIDKSKTINKNSNNNVKQMEVFNPDRICTIYISEFIEKIYNDIDNAYKIVTNFNSLEEFKTFISQNNLSSEIISCNLETNKENKRVYTIKDINNNSYTFMESSILNYTVSIKK